MLKIKLQYTNNRHGKRKATRHLTLLWVATMAQKHVSELVESFLLSQLQNLDVNIGLYRDDGVAISNATPRHTECIKKEICRVFNLNWLLITIEANKQIINFLDRRPF